MFLTILEDGGKMAWAYNVDTPRKTPLRETV